MPGGVPHTMILWLFIARAVAAIDIGQKIMRGAPVGVNVKKKCRFFRSKYWDKRCHSQRVNYTGRIYAVYYVR